MRGREPQSMPHNMRHVYAAIFQVFPVGSLTTARITHRHSSLVSVRFGRSFFCACCAFFAAILAQGFPWEATTARQDERFHGMWLPAWDEPLAQASNNNASRL